MGAFLLHLALLLFLFPSHNKLRLDISTALHTILHHTKHACTHTRIPTWSPQLSSSAAATRCPWSASVCGRLRTKPVQTPYIMLFPTGTGCSMELATTATRRRPARAS